MDPFENLVGNSYNKKYLASTIKRGTLGNSLLFSGAEGIGKKRFALAAAKLLLHAEGDPRIDLETHPDVHVYSPEGKTATHSIDAMRQFCHEVGLAPLEAEHKIFIIDHAERMSPFSANALLKTLEEPSRDSVIILITSHPDALLPTIISRCRHLRFHPLTSSVNPRSHIVEQAIAFISVPRWSSYQDLLHAAKELTTSIESQQKDEEEQWNEAHKHYPQLTAAQTHHFTKELEGLMSLRLQGEAYTLFSAILFWFRDLELLHLKGDPQLLHYRDKAETLTAQLSRNERLPLAYVEKTVAEAILSLSRSTPLQSVLQWLFLKLYRI